MLIQDTEPFLDLTQADLQDTFNAASVRHRIAIEPKSGQKTLTLRSAQKRGERGLRERERQRFNKTS